MNKLDNGQTPALAMPCRPEGRLTLRQFLRLVRDNTLATYSPDAIEEDIIAHRLLWRRRFIINEPNAIRHVLLDNAANYVKSELSRRLLEPGLGRGLLTSEGETWRRHRRIMAPAFDHRSIIGYAPIITGVTAGLLEQWDALIDSGEIDVAAAMMHTTLHIISRAMFSSDSDCRCCRTRRRAISGERTTQSPRSATVPGVAYAAAIVPAGYWGFRRVRQVS